MEQKDKFYTEVSGWDYVRFPLIKPYSVWTLDKGESWSFNYPDELWKKFIGECIFGIKKLMLLIIFLSFIVKNNLLLTE